MIYITVVIKNLLIIDNPIHKLAVEYLVELLNRDRIDT